MLCSQTYLGKLNYRRIISLALRPMMPQTMFGYIAKDFPTLSTIGVFRAIKPSQIIIVLVAIDNLY